MCKAVEEWIEDERKIGRAEGEQIGEKKGRDRAVSEIMKRMMDAGMDEAVILSVTHCTKEELAAAAVH